MCCFFGVLVFLGPRLAILVWWFAQPARWQAAFSSFFIPFIGFLFMPWTTLGWVAVAPGGVNGADWILVGLAVVIDIASYGGAARGRGTYS